MSSFVAARDACRFNLLAGRILKWVSAAELKFLSSMKKSQSHPIMVSSGKFQGFAFDLSRGTDETPL